jgi:cytochrome c
MSDLGFNKIAGAVLATGLAIVGLNQVSGMVFGHEPVEKAGYAIAVAESAEGGGQAAEVAPDWGTIIPTADPAAGQAVSAKCASCHNFDPSGANGTGPGLYGVLGRKPGSHPGFAYSAGMTEFGGKAAMWTYDELDSFLKAPQKYVSGTKMGFVGLKKQEDRIAMIAYLHSLGGTAPLPAPKPAAAPAEAAAAPAAEGAAAPAAAEAPATTAGAPAAAAPAATPAKK